jgi:hypothetical protein
MMAYTGSRDRVPLICNISTVLNFMLWLLYVCRQNTQNPLNRRLCGPLSLFGSFGGEKNLAPAGN